MSKKKQVKPEWFEGEVYVKGGTVTNPFSGEEYKLNGLELSIYDFIIGANMFLEMLYDNGKIGDVAEGENHQKVIRDLHKGLDWFKEYNPTAYMTLLD
jgi:hypothetical protein